MVHMDSLEVINVCEQNGTNIFEYALDREDNISDMSRNEIYSKMKSSFLLMKQSVKNGLEDKYNHLKPKMFDDDGKKVYKYTKKHNPISGETMAKAVAYALSVMEVNCSMGKIVACPTAGSCGVVPAALITVQNQRDFSDDKMVEGLFVAGLIGQIIAKNASLSGASGGCQAEIGSAAAMAAGACAFLCGASSKMVFDAAAIALNNLMGLVCDPVAGLVEVPCAKRNGIGVANALICADMVLSGLESVIPFDEVVWAMDKVGKYMHADLKETAEGGIAATPTAKRIKKEIYNE